MKKFILLSALFLYCFKICHAQPGELDYSFGTNGIVTTDLGESINYNSYGRQVVLQTDGSMYVIFQAGNQTLITKRLPNGLSDLSYGHNGFSVSVRMINAHAVMQSDGKIVVAGSTEIAHVYNYDEKYDLGIVRYNTNGSLDNTFDNDGKLTTDVGRQGNNDYPKAIALQKDGKIVVLGQSAYQFYSVLALARFNINGSLDTTFDTDGMLINDILTDFDGQADANSLAISNNGKILVAGSFISFNNNEELSDFALLRFNTDGALDVTFNSGAMQTTRFGSDNSFANTIAIQSDGKIVVAGNTAENFALARYTSDGNPDNTFSGDGKLITDFGSTDIAYSLAIESNGKIVAAGSSLYGSNEDFEIARYNTDGSLDITLSGDGKITSDLSFVDQTNSIAVQVNGKIVLTGYTSNGTTYDFAVVRYNLNGNLDNTFDGDGKLTDRFHQGSTVYYSTAVQSDEKIVAAGYTSNGSNYDFALVRYNTDGSFDNTFSGDGKQITDFGSTNDGAKSLAIQGDGKIILLGLAENDFALARYNKDGSLDNSFSNDGKQTIDFGPNDNANSVAIQSDGKIVVAGSSIARFNSNGSPDVSFGSNGKITPPLSCNDMVIQNDGKIVAVGYATRGNFNDFAIVRYNIDGSLDKSFSNDGIQTTDLNQNPYYEYTFSRARSVAIQSDGKIVVAGSWVSDYYKVYYSGFAIVRYNLNGSLDNSFSDDGKQITFFDSEYADANSVTIQSDGKIMAAGSSGSKATLEDEDSHFSLARYNADGSLDKSFGDEGKIISHVSGQMDFISDITISNNKLFAVGYGEFPGSLGIVARYFLAKENKAPSVTIITPLNHTVYTGPAKIYLSALASDEDGNIKKIQFYSGTTLLATENIFPYTYTWPDVPAGNYAITAKATDDKGSVTTSAVVMISVLPNKPPTVSITSPGNNTSYVAQATIRLIAEAKDADGKIKKVQFYNGTDLIVTENYFPYTYTWNNVAAGNYELTAKATDDKGAVTASGVVRVSVAAINKAPIVSITSPGNNTNYTGPAKISLIANAKDPDGMIMKVQFYNGAALLATENKFPYSYTWKNVPAGNYSITAKATDDKGIVTTSSIVRVSVAALNNPIVNTETDINNGNARIFSISALSVKATPNPAKNILNIYTAGFEHNKKLTISVVSVSGVLIKTKHTVSNRMMQMDVSSLRSGVYFLKVLSGDKILYTQFLKL